jgi:Tfp pilus assembly protein PilF
MAVQFHQSGKIEQAEQIYREILRVDPRHADALHLMAVAFQQRSNYADAVDYASRAVAANRAVGPYHSTLGAALVGQKRSEEAIKSFREAIRLDPKFGDAHFNLGRLYFAEGSYETALQHYERALELNQNNGAAWRDVGQIFSAQQKYREAVSCFREALRCQPDLGDAYFHLALTLARTGCLDEAAASHRGARMVRQEYAEPEVQPHRMLNALVDLDDAIRAGGNPNAAIDTSASRMSGMAQPVVAQPTARIRSVLDSFRRVELPATRFIRACETYSRGEDVLAHMIAAYEAAPLRMSPFEHFYVEGLFPDDFYNDLLANLPDTSSYDELAHKDAMLPNGRSSRLKFQLEVQNIKTLPEPKRSFWLDYAWVFMSDGLKFANFDKFSRKIHARVNPVLFRDIAGYKILPHPDIPSKKVTTQFYLPRDNSKPHLGTCLYTKHGEDEHDERSFAKAGQFAFRRNSGYSFVVCESSWHGVEQTDLGDGPRDSLMLIHFQE